MSPRLRNSACVCLVLFLTACGSTERRSSRTAISAAAKPYYSVKTLQADAETILVGRFGKKTSTQRNNGGNPADTEGTPVAFYELAVSRVLFGKDLGPRVEVFAFDAVVEDAILQPQAGQEVVIFATVLTSTTAPGLKLSGPTISVLSGNNGVFDVSNSRARARVNVVSLNSLDIPPTIPERGKTPLVDVTLSELEAAIKANAIPSP
jgi:hypothetical protein